jgi:hypothetical protein
LLRRWSGVAAAETAEQMAAGFAVAVQVLVFLKLLLELNFDYIDGGVHVNGTLFDDNRLVRQVQGHFAPAPVIAFLVGFLEVDFHVCAVAVRPGNVAVETADFTFDMRSQAIVYDHVYALDFELLQHMPSCPFNTFNYTPPGRQHLLGLYLII